MNKFIDEIAFPSLDLTIEDWHGEMINEILLYNKFLYSSSEKDFNEICLNHILVDVKGNTYQIIKKENLSKWRRYIPFIKKGIFIFKKLEGEKSLDEVKTHVINKIKNIKYNDDKNDKFLAEWIKRVEDSKSIKELLIENM